MKRQIFSLLTIAFIPVALMAQDDNNLVKNPGFEGTTGKLKRAKAINMAKDWKSPTPDGADLFSTTVKDAASPAAAPQNMYGKEDPAEGNNYAGLLMYSFGDKQARNYITTELLGPLKEGVQYCVSFKLSLADQSKYASNNIGAHLHKKEMAVDVKNKNIILETHVRHPKNKVITQSYGWEQVCNVYTAKGGEKYITLGNFTSTKETKGEKIPKPKGFVGQQFPYAYYYIDDIQVFQLDSIQQCMCDVPKEEKAKVVYSEEHGTNKEFTPEEKVAQSKVYFDNMSTNLRPEAVENLNKIIEVMNANADAKVDVFAHCDKTEYAKIEVDDRAKDLTANRGKAVIDFLVKGGIAKERLNLVIKEDQELVSNDLSELGMAKNRRVEFKMVK